MNFKPNGNRRWNRLIFVGVALFSVWIVAIVLSSVFGVNEGVGDDALLVGAAATFLTVLLGQVHHEEKTDANTEALKSISAKLDELLERER
jgi:hypothetical protein